MNRAAVILCLPLLAWEGAAAAPLPPVTGTLNGVTLAEALGRMEDLGLWHMRAGGWVRLFTIGSKSEIPCETQDVDSADCRTQRLFIDVYEAPTIAMDFTLFRSPEALRWYVPKDAKQGVDAAGDFTLPVEACSVKHVPGTDDYELYAESWRLRVHEELAPGNPPKVFAAFRAELEKLDTPRHKCDA